MSREEKELRFVLKNPATSMDDVSLSLGNVESLKVGDVKSHIASSYPGSPEPDRQRLIFAGQCLTNDDQPMLDVLRGRNIDAVHTFHIIIRPKSVQQQQNQNQPNQNHYQNQQNQHAQVPQQHQQQQQQVEGHQDDPPVQRVQPVVVGFGDNMALLFKLAVLIFVLSQGGGTMRAIMLYVFALFVFLYQTGRLRVLTAHINFRFPGRPDVAANVAAHQVQQEQPQQPQQPPAPAQIDPNQFIQDEAAAMEEARARAAQANQQGAQPAQPLPAAAAAAAAPLPPDMILPNGRPRPQGLLQELDAFFKPFFFSMIPSWNEHLPQWAQDLQ